MRHLPDLFCLVGVVLTTAAIWLLSPALALAVLGLFAVAAGLRLHRGERPAAVEPEPTGTVAERSAALGAELVRRQQERARAER